jgi:KDO2-lipid IV(A) lauroyltransferase
MPTQHMTLTDNKTPKTPKHDDAQLSLALFAPWRWPTWLGLGLLRMLEPLPYPLLMALGRALGWVVRRLPVKFARIARTNIRLCFPALSEIERESILDRHFESLGIALMETSMAWWSSDARISSLSRIEGMEHLEHAYTKGRGAILWAAHFTTLEIGARALSARVPLNILYRPTSNRVMAYFLARNRAKRAKRAIQRDDIRTVIGALKANEPVWYASDQSYRKKGAEMVPFFNVAAATNTATTRIARMSKTTVLPYFQERLPNNAGYRIVIGAPFEPFPTDDPIADALLYHRAIEAQVRHVPEQYLWIHRRFKGLSEAYPDYYRRDA